MALPTALGGRRTPGGGRHRRALPASDSISDGTIALAGRTRALPTRRDARIDWRRALEPQHCGGVHAMRGSMTAATFSPWIRSARLWRGSRSMPKPAPRRRASPTSSSGSRLRDGSCASTPRGRATMYRGTMLSRRELDALRQITDVVRLGRVRRIEADRIVLEHGEIETATDVLHIDCTALGLNNAPAPRSSSPAGSCSSRSGTSRLHSTQLSSASSRPAGKATRTRTGFAHLARTPAASRTGRA